MNDMNDMNDLLDLCRLTQLGENIAGSLATDAEATRRAIDMKRRELTMKLTANPPTVEPGVMERHRTDNVFESMALADEAKETP